MAMHEVRSALSRRQVLKAWTGATGLAATLALSRRAPGPLLSRARGDRPNIIFIVTDALRADHTGAYDYYRDTTPELDRWIANEGVTFRQATSSAAWTFPGTATMMTGRLPIRLNANSNNTVLRSSCPTLAELLRGAGYATAGFVAAPFSRGSRGFNLGFDVYDDSLTALPLDSNGQADQLNALAQQWLATWQGTAPLFLFLYYFDIHTWYRPPAPYDVRYDATYEGTLTSEVYKNGETVVAGTVVPSPRDVEHLRALYDGEIAYWDARLGEMLSALRDAGILDNAVVVLTSDHGDAFGEHGLWTHGNSVYEEILRVPLLIRYSGVIPKGLALDAPAQNMDLAPTLLEWAGVKYSHMMDGASLASAAAGQAVAPRDVFSEIDGITDPTNWSYWLAPRDTLHSIRRGEYKYIHHVGHEAADELYRIRPATVYEQENIIAAEPETAATLQAVVIEKFDQHRVMLPATVR
jgi:arylsulfatase A-like enzyme